jgi:cation transport regulator
MTYRKIDDLPQAVKDKLADTYSQRVFMTAFNSIANGNGDEEAAERVAWQTIERSQEFICDADGKWRTRTDFPVSGHGAVATMPGN